MVISIQIANEKKAISDVYSGLAAITFADISQGHDITYHELVKHISVHLYKSDQQIDETNRPNLAHALPKDQAGFSIGTGGHAPQPRHALDIESVRGNTCTAD